MRQVTGPDGGVSLTAAQFHAYRDFTLLHHALAIRFLVIRIAAAVLGDPDIIQVQVQGRHVEIIDTGITYRRQDTTEVRIGCKESCFYQR